MQIDSTQSSPYSEQHSCLSPGTVSNRMPIDIMTAFHGFINTYYPNEVVFESTCIDETGAFEISNWFCTLLPRFVLAVQFRHRHGIVLWKVPFFIAFRAVRVFSVRSSHSCFCHKNHLGISVPAVKGIIPISKIRIKMPLKHEHCKVKASVPCIDKPHFLLLLFI